MRTYVRFTPVNCNVTLHFLTELFSSWKLHERKLPIITLSDVPYLCLILKISDST